MSGAGERAVAASTPAAGERFACAWSGGKDSYLALHRAVAGGGRALALVTLLDDASGRTRSHGLPWTVVQGQARALGVTLRGANTTWSEYERHLVGLLRAARLRGAASCVFGDMDVESHGRFEIRAAEEAALAAHLPLWGEPRDSVLSECFELSVEARIGVVRDGALPREMLGRRLDPSLVRELERHGVDPCGENGEYHTVVTNAPLFRRPLRLRPGAVVRRADCWVLDWSGGYTTPASARRARSSGPRPSSP